MLDSNKYHNFFDEEENPISDYELTNVLELQFNGWFSNLLTETKRNEAGVYYTVANTLEDVAECISDEDLAFMCYCAYWDNEYVFNDDKRNAVYWYALHLLYTCKGDIIEEGKCSCGCDGKFFDYSGVWLFLDSLNPIKTEA